MLKKSIRYWLGQCLHSLGLTETIRRFYLGRADAFVHKNPILAAWVRRSLVNQDFRPLTSDIDVTVLIDERELPRIVQGEFLKPTFWVRDIQVISLSFFEDWKKTGGWRNYVTTNWQRIQGSTPLSPPSVQDDEALAFDIGHELYLLYRQLNEKLSESNTLDELGTKKLKCEMERLRLFWRSRNSHLLFTSRFEFQPTQDFWKLQEEFWNELLSTLPSPLQDYDPRPEFVFDLKFNRRQTVIVEEVLDSHHSLDEFPLTRGLLRLFKGVGIQEQDLLNQSTKAYFLTFSRQRLAHDLIGALLFAPEDSGRLYYCFENCDKFFRARSLSFSSSLWKLGDPLPWNRSELLHHSIRYLELLKSVG